MEELSPGEFVATVLGTDTYEVQLELSNGEVSHQQCDCPYDLGPVCKHVVAVLFHIQQDELELKKAPKTKKSTKPRGRSVLKQVEDVLSSLSHKELKEYMRQLAKTDTSFRRELLSHFAHLNKNENMTLYAQQVKDILRSHSQRDGFVDWNAARKVGKAVIALMNMAHGHAEKSNFRTAIHISFAVMEQMVDALQYADDSNGDIGGNIDDAHHLLLDVARENLEDEMRTELLNLSLTAYENRVFDGWDWDLGMLELASDLVRTENEVQRLSGLLEKAIKNESDFWRAKAEHIKLKLLQRSGSDDATAKFMEANLHNPLIRMEAIETAMRVNAFDKAIRLAEEGIELDREKWPGRVWDWYDMLLQIAKLQNDTAKVIEYARLLYLNSNLNTQPFYLILKETISEEEWPAFVDGLIAELNRSGSWVGQSRTAQILVDEQRWQQLMEWLQRSMADRTISLRTVTDLEKYLAADHSEELSNLYHTGIIDLLKANVGRKYYIEACRYMRRMNKLGATEQVAQLMWHLRKTYPQRPALMEELNNV